MNILQRAKEFVQSLRASAERSPWEWRRCPHCGSGKTIKNGSYRRHPLTLAGRVLVRVQRHRCNQCGRSYAETSAELVENGWYGRDVRRYAVDQWMHGRMSLRRVAEFTRSWIGRQERWLLWHPLGQREEGEPECYLNASTVHRWLDRAGEEADGSVAGQLEGVACSGEMGTDGLWARLQGGSQRVVLALVDSVTGVIWPPVVALGEGTAAAWQSLFERAKKAGIDLQIVNGITSDGAQGLLSYLRQSMSWAHQQRCVWHLWRSISRVMAQEIGKAVAGLEREKAEATGKRLRRELGQMVRNILDASSYKQGEKALDLLAAHAYGKRLAHFLNPLLDATLMHLMACHQGLLRVSPEWLWRDFRQRLSRGRNHGSEQRLERAGLLWAIYHNFTPAQRRYEHKRHYRHPGLSPLEVAGSPPGTSSYLDALRI